MRGRLLARLLGRRRVALAVSRLVRVLFWRRASAPGSRVVHGFSRVDSRLRLDLVLRLTGAHPTGHGSGPLAFMAPTVIQRLLARARRLEPPDPWRRPAALSSTPEAARPASHPLASPFRLITPPSTSRRARQGEPEAIMVRRSTWLPPAAKTVARMVAPTVSRTDVVPPTPVTKRERSRETAHNVDVLAPAVLTRLTDQVIGTLDRRLIAHRERLGRR